MRSGKLSVLSLLLVSSVAAPGCSFLSGLVHRRTDGSEGSKTNAEAFDPAAVTDVTLARVDGKKTFCAAEAPIELALVATTSDGRTWSNREGDHRLPGDALTWSANGGEVEGGTFRPALATMASPPRPVTIDAHVAHNETSLTLEPSFDCEQMAAFSGAAGEVGAGGVSGPQGNSAGSGQNGGAGGAGSDGSRGADGLDAPAVRVALGYVETDAGRLVLARVSDGSRTAYVLVDPNGPPLTIDARGGAGGQGGSGGAGGLGGFGYSEGTVGACCNTAGGSGGIGGAGGPGGDGGRGAKVVVEYDKAHPELRQRVEIDNRGGAAGPGGFGGASGSGGPGGSGSQGEHGPDGAPGQGGPNGPEGRVGPDGPAPEHVAVAAKSLFRDEIAGGLEIAE